MSNLVRVVALLCALVFPRVSEATGNLPSLCDVCACSSSLKNSTHVDTASCNVLAIRPQDIAFLSTPHQLCVTLNFFSLTCHSTSWPSTVNRDTIGSLDGLEELHVENCDLSSGLTYSSFKSMTRLKKLTFADCILPEAVAGMEPPNYLSPISSLESLSVTGCKLSHLPAMPRWRQLRHFNVSHNNLHSLDFVQLTSEHGLGFAVDELSLQENGSDDIKTGLTVLDASHNPMVSLPTSAIVLSPRLERLVLQGVPLTEFRLPDDLDLPELIVLDISDSNLAVLKFHRLCASVNLEEVYLQGSGVPVVLDGLSCLTNLTRLTLVKLGLDSTLWEQLPGPNMDRLILSHNNLTSVYASQYPNLRVLVLDHNQISSINASSSFANLPKLQLLNISFNVITELPYTSFLGADLLKVLDLSNNKLRSIRSPTFSNMRDLSYLNLARNDIASMDFTLFQNSHSMKWLFLQHNKIKYLPKLSTMGNLLWLNVSFNQMRSIEPRHLIGLTNLIALFASNNSLQRISDRLFSNTPSLTEAWFNNNEINNVGNLGNHRNLKTLRLDYNFISDFLKGSPFRQLETLTFLSLDYNRITKIRRFSYPQSLRFLFLSSNYIDWFEPESFANLPHLQYVRLENNNMIFTLPLTAVNGFKMNYPKPQFIVGGNQFFCNCQMAYLKLLFERPQEYDLFLQFYPTFLGLEHTWCEVVYEGKYDRRFKDVPLGDFACQYPDHYCRIGCNCCDVSLVQGDPVPASCECKVTCPTGCSCYIAGASMLKDYFHIRCDSRNFEQVPDRIPPVAVNLFLDGNNITNVSNTDFHRLGQLENIYLNSSAVTTLQEGSFTNCIALKFLYLDHNSLRNLHGDTFLGLSSLTHLYLHHNAIEFISPGALDKLLSLQVLTLHNNHLSKIGSSLDGLPRSLERLTLSYNPWSCDCQESKDLDDFLHFRSKAIVDKGSVCCYVSENDRARSLAELDEPNTTSSTATVLAQSDRFEDSLATSSPAGMAQGEVLRVQAPGEHNPSNPRCVPLWTSDFSQLCGNNSETAHNPDSWRQYSTSSRLPVAVVVLIILAVLLFTAACFVIFVIFKRKELQALAYAKLGIRILDKKAQVDKEDKGSKAFDAFISYSSKDDEFVAGTLVPALEDPKRGYRVCVHYRDFPVGSTITDTICKAIESSSRTILLLSQNFLKSEWCRFEFQTAHRHILREGSHRLVIVLYGELQEDMLDPDLQVHLKSRSYLRFEDPYFWEKLYFALPDIRQRKANEDKEQDEGDRKNEVDPDDVEIQAMAAIRAMRVLTGTPLDDARQVEADVKA